MQKNEKNLSSVIYAAMAIAMVTLATMAIRIPSPRGGYINFGDILIFTSAILIGRRTGFLAGGIGSALADILSGYGAYAPATFIIKGVEGFICGSIVKKNNDGRVNIPSLIIAALLSASWMVFGYFAYEYIIMGIAGALPNVPGNMVQGAVSAIAVIPVVITLRKTKLSFNNK